MNFKKVMSIFVIATLLAVTLVGCGSQETSDKPADEQKQIVLKLSEAQVDDYPDSVAEKAFAKMVEERSNGRIKVDVYTGGQLGDEKTTVEQVQVGIIDIGRANVGPLAQFSDKLGIFSFPFLFDSRDHMWNVLGGEVGDMLFTDLEKSNIIGLAFYDAGARNFYTKEPINTIDDIQGMKIRVMQNDILLDAFEKLGVSPTPMSASEVYSGLQMGVIEGGENNVNTYVADGHYEIAKNFTLSEHLRMPGVLFMSKKSWDSLSKEDQEIIAQAAKESEAIQMEEFDKYAQKAMDKVLEKGNTVIELSKEDKEKFRNKVKPVYEQYNDKFGEMFTKIDEAR